MKAVIALGCLIFVFAACSAAVPTQTVTPIISLTSVRRPSATPSPMKVVQQRTSAQITGTLVVVFRQAAEFSSTSAITVSNLGIVSLPEGTLVSLTSGGYRDQGPRWSRNGHTIAFSSNRSGQFNIFLIDQNGSNLTQLTEGEGDKFSPTWASDGRKLAYVSRKMGQTGLEFSTINIMDIGTHKVTSILKVPANNWEQAILALDWSPTNINLMLYSKIEPILGWQNEEYSASSVYLFDLISGESIALTSGGWSCDSPRWSPDGRYVLMNGCFPVGSDGGSSPMIGTLVNTAGNFSLKGLRLLESIAPAVDIAWSPDGQMWLTDRFERDGTSILQVHRVQSYLTTAAYPLLEPFDMIGGVNKSMLAMLNIHTQTYSYQQPDWK